MTAPYIYGAPYITDVVQSRVDCQLSDSQSRCVDIFGHKKSELRPIPPICCPSVIYTSVLFFEAEADATMYEAEAGHVRVRQD